MDRRLGDRAGAVKAEVQELELLRRDAAGQSARPCLRLPDDGLDLEQIGRVGLPGLLGPEKLFHPFLDVLGLLVVDVEQSMKLADKIDKACGVVVKNGNVAAGHVSDVNF